MAKMQVVQPHLKKIQEKYRDNPQKLQAEIMRVYREHGVNPMAGCLPMFIQLPVLFSAYGGIRAYAYQFNQAPPVLGINLGQPNLILLLLYAVSMYVSQKLAMMRNPQGPMDPQQEQMQKMMLFMPLMFTVMMWTYGWPSAFYLYWLAFNVVSTAEQWFVTSKLKKPVGTGVRPLVGAEGSLDQADGGKEGKPLAPAAEKEEKPSRPRPRSQRRPLSVVPPPGSKESRKRRVTRRR
jgi:YidC/Oxa1 family membrane protein insertase